MRVDWKTVLGLAVTAFLFWWLFRGEDPVAIWNQVREADGWLLLLSVAITTSGFAVRALRWKIFLEPVQANPRFRSRFAAVCIGFMTNNLLPARLGEFTRPYAYSRMEPVPATGALATLVVERLFDGAAILALLFFALVHPSFPAEGLPPAIAAAARITAGSLGLLLLGLVMMLIFPDQGLRAVEAVAERVLPRKWADMLMRAGRGFLDGLASLRSPRLLTWGMIWSLGFWLLHSLSFWVGLMAFDIHLPYTAALFMNATIAFMVALPAAPGFFGTFHTGVKLALVDVYAVGAAPALGFAFGWHLGSFFPVTFMGLWYVRKLGLSFEEMTGSRPASFTESAREGV